MTTAIVGRTGSGKTYTAKGITERHLRANDRVCVIDPTGAWWGLRLAADGVAAGVSIVIFGGAYGDIPINPEDGERLADVIVDGRVKQTVIDVSDMSGVEQTKFLTAFLERLYTKNRAPLLLVLDEADIMAPQNPLPEARRLQGAVNKIVRRGRIKGFRPIMITQRPAVLDKSVLSQIDTLIAHWLTAPQDRKAIEEWVKGNADTEAAKAVLESLASLKVGEGWYWSPAHDVLERRTFPEITTFDSSRSPVPGDAPREPLLLTDTEIETLRRDFSARSQDIKMNPAAVEFDQTRKDNDIADAERRGIEIGQRMSSSEVQSTLNSIIALLQNTLDQASTIIEKHRATFRNSEIENRPAELELPQTRDIVYAARPEPAHMSPTARKILDVIHAAYPLTMTFKAAALRAGASTRSSAYKKHRDDVLSSGEVELTADGRLGSTHPAPFTKAIANPIEAFASKLSPSWAAMLRAIAAGGSMTREAISELSGVSLTSSGFSSGLRELLAMELITKDGDRRYAITDALKDNPTKPTPFGQTTVPPAGHKERQMPLANPNLPAHHPQNVPLKRWSDGWLTLSVCGYTDAAYMVSHDHEKRARGWPVTREEKIALLVEKGDIPSAGVE